MADLPQHRELHHVPGVPQRANDGEDAYGHRKMGGIGMSTGEALRRLTGIDILYQPLG